MDGKSADPGLDLGLGEIPEDSQIGKILVAWELYAPSWQALEERMRVLPQVLAQIPLEWGARAGLPSALPSVKGWWPRLKHKGIGEVRSNGNIKPGDPVEAIFVLAALRTDVVTVKFVDDLGNEFGKLSERPSLLEAFGVTIEQVSELGGEALGLVEKLIKFGGVYDETADLVSW
jgi:hypothetical protein